MIEALAVTLLPLGFLVVLFWGGARFQRKNIAQDGEAPIRSTQFYLSKYAIVGLWVAMILQSWGIGVSLFEVPLYIRGIALVLWCAGFALLYVGRFEMGSSFRLGTPKEQTSLKVDGLFSRSRNPMYVGMYATVIASALYTVNPVVVLLGAFVIVVHHSIVLAEERFMRNAFGREYEAYFARVPRYV